MSVASEAVKPTSRWLCGFTLNIMLIAPQGRIMIEGIVRAWDNKVIRAVQAR